MSIDVVAEVNAANEGRRPEALALKYEAMRGDPFAFFRGTATLFARDWEENAPQELRDSPLTWVCGDAHLENLGTYRAQGGLVVFELNDFDETFIAPALYDLARLATSGVVWQEWAKRGSPPELIATLSGAYCSALALGKPLWIDRDTATGPIAALMQQVYARGRTELLEKWTTLSGKHRTLTLGKRTLPIDDEERRRATAAVAAFGATTSDPPSRYDVLDVAWRLAGNGSLGLERYVVLIAGDGTPDGARLMDVKFAAPSSLSRVTNAKPPPLGNDAERVVAGYRRLQCRTPYRLGAVVVDGRPFVVRALQPSEDRIDVAAVKQSDVDDLTVAFGSLVGWAHLRAGGREGSAIADTLIAFAGDASWREPLTSYVLAAADRFREYWETWKEKAPPVPT
ncbi:MAG: DUF2252 family protein [Candidatus Eremiobacteraeota bacterium]|nr:DUF2252 family protein [Candidatus Eremiobacteraeota bacterium]